MALQLVTPAPTPGLIKLADAKAQLRIEPGDTYDDALITGLILSASDLVQDYTARRYLPETWNWILESWYEPMVLPLAPATHSDQVAINEITYAPLSGPPMLTLDTSIYWARPAGPTVKIVKQWFVIWPFLGDAPERVIVNFSLNAGVPAVPMRVQHAVKLLVSHWYQNRDAVVGVDGRDSSTELPLGVVNLLYAEMWDQPARP